MVLNVVKELEPQCSLMELSYLYSGVNNSNVSNAFLFCAYLDRLLSVVLEPPYMLLRVCIITPCSDLQVNKLPFIQ